MSIGVSVRTTSRVARNPDVRRERCSSIPRTRDNRQLHIFPAVANNTEKVAYDSDLVYIYIKN